MEEEVFVEEVVDGTGVEVLGNIDAGRLQTSAQAIGNGVDQPVLGVVPEAVYENRANDTAVGEIAVECVVVRHRVVLTVLARSPSSGEWTWTRFRGGSKCSSWAI